jgi:uncharacterized protein YdbL (DUF1318 family)
MKTRNLRRIAVLGVLLFTMACVTVNIYFPAAKVEKTADEIVKDVYKGVEKNEPKKPGGSSSLLMLLAWLGPQEAYAADATTVSNASIRALKNNIKGRVGQLAPYFAKGNVGVDKRGYLAERNTQGLSVPQVAQMKRLIAADNADRRRLYDEVARALNQPQNASKVEGIFAGKWRSEAPGGWWIQENNGNWRRK